jgi:hypothetical protein
MSVTPSIPPTLPDCGIPPADMLTSRHNVGQLPPQPCAGQNTTTIEKEIP